MLSQRDDDRNEYVIAYVSRSNNKAESNYSNHEGEAMAVVWAITHYRHYLYGKPFTLVTDHQPLEWILTNNKLTGKHARWALILQEYDFKIVHRPELKHANADVCLRHPLPTTVDNGARRDHDAGESDRAVAVVAWLAEVWLGYTAPVVVIARAARVQADVASNPTARQGGPPNIWTDQLCMHQLVYGDMLDTASQSERDKINKRVRKFTYSKGLLYHTSQTTGRGKYLGVLRGRTSSESRMTTQDISE